MCMPRMTNVINFAKYDITNLCCEWFKHLRALLPCILLVLSSWILQHFQLHTLSLLFCSDAKILFLPLFDGKKKLYEEKKMFYSCFIIFCSSRGIFLLLQNFCYCFFHVKMFSLYICWKRERELVMKYECTIENNSNSIYGVSEFNCLQLFPTLFTHFYDLHSCGNRFDLHTHTEREWKTQTLTYFPHSAFCVETHKFARFKFFRPFYHYAIIKEYWKRGFLLFYCFYFSFAIAEGIVLFDCWWWCVKCI
jgi:hypothetical protein